MSSLSCHKHRRGPVVLLPVRVCTGRQQLLQRVGVALPCCSVQRCRTVTDAVILDIRELIKEACQFLNVALDHSPIHAARGEHAPRVGVDVVVCIALHRGLHAVLRLRWRTRDEVQDAAPVLRSGGLRLDDVDLCTLGRDHQREGASSFRVLDLLPHPPAPEVHAQRRLRRDRLPPKGRHVLREPRGNVKEMLLLPFLRLRRAHMVLEHAPNPLEGGHLPVQQGQRSLARLAEDRPHERCGLQLAGQLREVVLVVGEGADPIGCIRWQLTFFSVEAQ
mmetsp:Transcript_134293/g.374292  ORF Transcript_134293/g.374292 Transcript_134293/m.374292 type:complete len:277 (+) Transcript_134293:155-985(+)